MQNIQQQPSISSRMHTFSNPVVMLTIWRNANCFAIDIVEGYHAANGIWHNISEKERQENGNVGMNELNKVGSRI